MDIAIFVLSILGVSAWPLSVIWKKAPERMRQDFDTLIAEATEDAEAMERSNAAAGWEINRAATPDHLIALARNHEDALDAYLGRCANRAERARRSALAGSVPGLPGAKQRLQQALRGHSDALAAEERQQERVVKRASSLCERARDKGEL